MPELPEVQTTVNGINKYVKNHIIYDVWTSYNSTYHKGKDNIKNPKFFSGFKKKVIGMKILGAERRAKNIIMGLSSGDAILVHLKMTGHLLYGKYDFDKKNKKDPWKGVAPKALTDPFNRHIRFVLTLSDGKYLALSDMRRFAKITHIKEKDLGNTAHLENIGPEPLEKNFTEKKLSARLHLRPNMRIKLALMDQSLIAGIGNIYSDEILWRSSVHPERKVKQIRPIEFKAIYKAMRDTLKKGICLGGDSMSDYRNILGEKGKFQEKHNAYRKTGTKCAKPRCGGIIRRIVVGSRGTHYCDLHQK